MMFYIYSIWLKKYRQFCRGCGPTSTWVQTWMLVVAHQGLTGINVGFVMGDCVVGD